MKKKTKILRYEYQGIGERGTFYWDRLRNRMVVVHRFKNLKHKYISHKSRRIR